MIFRKGAEASLLLEEWQGMKVLMKHRLPKKYRIPEIDQRIRAFRTIHEAHLLHSAKEAGVPTPTIFMIDLINSNIIMEFIEGKQVKQVLDTIPFEKRRKTCIHIGKLIGLLHRNAIVHGDLTTSNMIITSGCKIFLVDFGLGERTNELESIGVDLHLMKKAFQSTHFRFADECFNATLVGYTKILGREISNKVLNKIEEIEKRGRYISTRRQEESN